MSGMDARDNEVLQRLELLEDRVANVAQLASATAEGVGTDRSLRQLVLFVQGAFNESLTDKYRIWTEGAAAARASAGDGGGGDAKPPPLKLQVVQSAVGQLRAQGLEDEVYAAMQGIPGEAVETCFHGTPGPDKVWVLVVMFRVNEAGLRARALFDKPKVRKAVVKGASGYPMLGIRPGRFLPGPLHREVLGDLGYGDDDVAGYFKGKGKGGKGSTSGKSSRKGEGNKRQADRCSSAMARDDGRLGKRAGR